MVQFNRFALALPIAHVAAAPAWNLPSWGLSDLPFLSDFTLPTVFPTGLPTALPTFGAHSTTSKAPTVTTKTASSATSQSTSAPVSTGTSIVTSTSPSGTGIFSSAVVVSGSAKAVSSVKVGSSSASKAASSLKPASSGVSSSFAKPPTTTGSSSQPTVSTTSGKVVGHPAPNTTNVFHYLGIKFGQAPVGDLRFAAPVKYTGTGLINGSAFAADCPSKGENVPTYLDARLYSLLSTLAQVNDTQAEDCLFLNVWAKGGAKNKPVLVWIYGGGFNFGGTNSAAYNGRYFADQEDVVFVSLNYRTNVFGFPGSPNQTANVGLLDQRLAIEWIRDNIAAFGGNPDLITIFGQSAGGASTDLYTFTYYDDPIIAGAIPMSGSANSFGSRTAADSLASWDNVTATVGCGNSTTSTNEAVLACMRSTNVSTSAIVEAAAAGPGLGSLLGRFGPTIDEKVVFSNYTERALDGYVAKVPVLTGNLNDESGLFILISAGAGEGYPQSTWDYINQQVFTCPVSRIARYRADIGIPVWRYYYSGAFPNLLLPTANITQAWHTSEIPVLFGVADQISLTANTANETALGNYMRGAWAAFAADPANGLSANYGWPQYSTGNLIGLGQNNETTARYSNSSAIEDGCSF